MNKRLKIFLVSIGIIIVLFFIYVKFEFTLVPDAREFIAGADSKQGAELGGLLFSTRGCTGCHTFHNVSNSSLGPDLTNIADRLSDEQLKTAILDPEESISSNCNGQPCVSGFMPVFADILDDNQVSALVLYLKEYGE